MVGVELNSKAGVVRLGLASADQFTSAGASSNRRRGERLDPTIPSAPFKSERGALVIPLGADTTWIELIASAREAK